MHLRRRSDGMIRARMFFCALLFSFAASLPARTAEGFDPTGDTTANFTQGRFSFEMMTGPLLGSHFPHDHAPILNYWQTNFRLGWMLNTPSSKNSLLRGNFELLLEGTTSAIYQGPGNYLIGITALFRYNFVQPDSKLIPYAQIGAGIVYNDVYKTYTQDAIGQSIEFTPQASIGLHYLIRPNWSINAEAMYHHISNAGLASRNVGINSFGGLLGLTYFFR